jgi:ABC-type proline/glycine betaine transport system permease subunit
VIAEFSTRRNSTANVHMADRQLWELAEAKRLGYHFARWEFLLFAVLVPCFVLALLISIFKNIYWQPFLIALVCCALLPILILIFALITEHSVFHVDEERIMLWCYYLIAVLLVLTLFAVPQARAYRTRLAVTTILANVALPFLAVFTLFILDEEFDVFGKKALLGQMGYYASESAEWERLNELLHAAQARAEFFFKLAFWSGLVLYALVLHPLLRNLYARLVALAERK